MQNLFEILVYRRGGFYIRPFLFAQMISFFAGCRGRHPLPHAAEFVQMVLVYRRGGFHIRPFLCTPMLSFFARSILTCCNLFIKINNKHLQPVAISYIIVSYLKFHVFGGTKNVFQFFGRGSARRI